MQLDTLGVGVLTGLQVGQKPRGRRRSEGEGGGWTPLPVCLPLCFPTAPAAWWEREGIRQKRDACPRQGQPSPSWEDATLLRGASTHGPTAGQGAYPAAGKGPVNGCGLGLAPKPAPPGVLAHKAGECKHRLGRQLPGGGAAPAQVAGLSPGPGDLGEPCSKTKPKATSLQPGSEFTSLKIKLSPPTPAATATTKQGWPWQAWTVQGRKVSGAGGGIWPC